MNYRHGDIAFIGIDKLPDGLKISDTKILRVSSGGNPHTYNNGEFYPIKNGDFVFGYFIAKDTKLYHAEHGLKIGNRGLRIIGIIDGIYELRNQMEDTNQGMKPIID